MNIAPFKIVTPDGVIYEDDIVKVTIPTQAGEITLLPDHAPLVSVLKPGEINISKDGSIIDLAVSTGILEIRPSGEIFILADTAERAEHIDIDRAEEARKRAEKLLKEHKDVEDVAYAKIMAKMEKELARISVGRKYRK
jgi:F-type H+-transporting ATPase subunit epsilon